MMKYMKAACRAATNLYWLAWPVFLLKVMIFYRITEIPDLAAEWAVPGLTFLFLTALFEVCSVRGGRGSRYAFYFMYTLLTEIFFADAAYYSYFGRYTSLNQLFQLGSLGQVAGQKGLLASTVNPFCLLLLADLPFMLLCFQGRNRGGHETLTRKLARAWKKGDRAGLVKTGSRLLVRLGLLAGAGGAWYYYSFNPANLREVQRINHMEIISYHTNDILVNVLGRLESRSVDREAIKDRIRDLVPASEGTEFQNLAKGKNLILIQTESLNDFVIGADYNGQEITPNLNRLIREDSFYFDHFYSTTGVGNTSDAEFAALNSLYPNDERECYRMYVDNSYYGLPWMFREEGYEALAFHGYDKTFWNRHEAYKNQGFQKFYSQDQLDMTEVSGYGLTDKELFRQSVDLLKDREKPFFAFMITLTNHIPYELDPALASLKLDQKDQGSLFGNYLQTVRYTDEAFGQLIDRLKEERIYEDTVIVIYGDHQGLNRENPAVRERMKDFLGKDYDYDEMLKVPLLIHIPGLGENRKISTVGGQVDIMPTLAGLMGLEMSQPYVFGHDLLNAKEGFEAQISYVGKGSFISGKGDVIYIMGRDGLLESGRMISLKSGRNKHLDMTLAREGSERALGLLETCKEVLDHNLIADYVRDR